VNFDSDHHTHSQECVARWGGHAIALIDIGTLIKVVPLYFVGEGSVQGQNRYTDRSGWHCSVLCRGGYAIAWIGIGTLIEVVPLYFVGEGPGKNSRDKIDTLIDACVLLCVMLGRIRHVLVSILVR